MVFGRATRGGSAVCAAPIAAVALPPPAGAGTVPLLASQVPARAAEGVTGVVLSEAAGGGAPGRVTAAYLDRQPS